MIALGSSGIYAITNLNDGRCTAYVGSTAKSFKKRWGQHRGELRRGVHPNHHLQAAWNMYGEKSFAFTILEIADNPDKIIEREQFWLDEYQDTSAIYNISLQVEGNGQLGYKHTMESRRKMSEAHKGEKHHLYGKSHTEETKRKISLAHTGRKFSEKHKNKLSQMRGRPYPAFHNLQTGETIPAGLNLRGLCREHGLDCRSMWKVKSGKIQSHKGWALITTTLIGQGNIQPYPAFHNQVTGRIIPAGRNLSALCRERGLNFACMWDVAHGRRVNHQGWTLYNEEEK